MKKFLTLEDLAKFCSKNNFSYFNSIDHNNKPLIVQSLGFFEEVGDEVDNEGLLPVVLQACHTELNNNKSYIEDDVMELRLPTLSHKPILGDVVEDEDGNPDFSGHTMELVDDPFNEGEKRVNYIERVVGILKTPTDAVLEYDKKKKKNYVKVSGYIYEEYGNLAADIIRKRKKCSVSVELVVKEFAYDAKEKVLKILDFYFNGVTILGENVKPGMAGSNITLESFSEEENGISSFSQDKLVEILDKLNTIVSNFQNIEKTKVVEGGNEQLNFFEEMLKQYSATIEQLTFDFQNMSDEELKEAFKSQFEGSTEDGDANAVTTTDEEDGDGVVVNNEDNEDGADGSTGDNNEDNGDSNFAQAGSAEPVVDEGAQTPKNYEVRFEVSHDDIRSGLYTLVNLTAPDEATEEDYFYRYILAVYDSYFIYEEYFKGYKTYKQSYTREGDNLALSGGKAQVFATYLTKEEQEKVEEMRANYTALVEFKQGIELEAERAEKELILKDEEVFSVISESEGYKELVSNMDKYSKEELQEKCDALYGKCIKESKQFSFASNDSKTSKKIGNVDLKKEDEPKTKLYGSIFD